ncbi:histidine phosphatase family protein [Deinococcus sp. MIMF12]|uniref:Histidine phosphatase family protein n=1 Tax=Deinococcus rhizophilus TaxID=3049544 RepID=A0ABT7JLE3_9DEIO|nr:histidine phosphatase family protein [Deinococcus rhizophilus]MDL2345288.1 histidine phosphatase family protein [Deinococcus rhizophilus]
MVYLLRHGQTEWNVEGRPQGRLDSPLTPLGVAQARAHAVTLSGVPLRHAYSSPMGRARRTAEFVLEERAVPLTVLETLAEVDAGELAGLLKAERVNRFPDLAAARERDKYRTVLPGGESYETASPRAARALQTISRSGGGNVLIVSHEMIGRLLRMHLLGLSPRQAMALSHPQDVIYRVESGTLTASVSGSAFAPVPLPTFH